MNTDTTKVLLPPLLESNTYFYFIMSTLYKVHYIEMLIDDMNLRLSAQIIKNVMTYIFLLTKSSYQQSVEEEHCLRTDVRDDSV